MSTEVAVPTFRRIVVGHDGSPPADVALGLAEQCAGEASTLIVARVVKPAKVLAGAPGDAQDERAAVAQLAAVAECVAPWLTVETRVVAGHSVARTLAELAEEEAADLIVVGSHRHAGDFRTFAVL